MKEVNQNSPFMGGRNIKVADRCLKPGGPALLVAEIGGNHGGDPYLAEKMVSAAAQSGAVAVKFQAYRTPHFVSPQSSYYEELAAEELSFEILERLGAQAKALGLIFGLTVFDQKGLELAAEVADFIKISSGDLTYHDLLARATRSSLPIFVSTGAANQAEVEAACQVLIPARERIALLQCVSLYPAPPEGANLEVMVGWLRQGLTAGYSDHMNGLEAATMALALGAQIVEKHFTISRKLPGGDNAISAEPSEMAFLSRFNQMGPLLRGLSDKSPLAGEEKMRLVIRRVLVATRDLPAGQTLTPGDLACLRPGDGQQSSRRPGLGPNELSLVVGLTLGCNLACGETLTPAHVLGYG